MASHLGYLAAMTGLAAGACVPAPTHRTPPTPVCAAGESAAPAPRSMAAAPPLYGFWGLNGYITPEGLQQVKSRLGATVFQVACSDPVYAVTTLLPMVRAAGLKVTLRLTADHDAYTTDGNFDLGAWEAGLAPWVGSGVQAFVDDGTLVGHMLLDDIQNFEGRNPDAADLEAMARCSKRLFPGLMTYVREKASSMPVPTGGRYLSVDASVNQYEAREGDVTRYAAVQAMRAEALGLGVINGLNIADGGDGSSGRRGYRPGRYAMSASEIGDYGRVLAAVPSCGMFLNWEYDGEERWADGAIGSRYFDQPKLTEALIGLSRAVASHPPVLLANVGGAP